MTSNKLRIGNYVKLMLNDEDFTIIRIRLTDLEYIEQKQGIYKPIQITEEVLFKLGLKKYKDADIPSYYIKFGNFIEDDFEYCFMIFQDVDGNYYTQIFGKKIILSQVHRLQNLFYEITEEELSFI